MASRVVFERNLAALRGKSLGLDESLATVSTEGVEEEVGPRGARILVEAGVRLGSAYDPVREGVQIAEQMAAEPADIMVAVGFGLGEQFEPYLERNPATLIIFEPSSARLAAALRIRPVADWLERADQVFFVDDAGDLARVLSACYAPGLRLRVFPHPAVFRIDPEGVSAAVRAVRDSKDVVDLQRITAIEMLMPWAWVTARNAKRIAASPHFGELAGAFEGVPAVVVAAGPSLDKQLDQLRAIQDRVVVLAIGQTTRALRQAGITPHLVHIVESRDVSHQITDAGDSSDLIIAPSCDADPAIFDVPHRARFTVTVGGNALGRWIAGATGESRFAMGGGTVAQSAVGLAAMLGCGPIALIGQDLAFTDGRAYGKGTAYDFVEVEMKEDGQCRFEGMNRKAEILNESVPHPENGGLADQRVVWVDGWNEGERVPTWRAYASFLQQYREIGIAFRERGIALMNCTEGGARIPEVEHRTFASFAEEFARDDFDVRGKLLEIHDAAVPKILDDYMPALERGRKTLDRIQKEADKGMRFARKAKQRLTRVTDERGRVAVLRGLARFEKRVRRQLEAAAWLDMLVQPEIYNAIAAARRTERHDPTDEDLVDEAVYVLEAAQKGIGRARSWFEAFEGAFDSAPLEGESVTKARSGVSQRTAGETQRPSAGPRVGPPPA